MKVRCIDNHKCEKFLTENKIYEVIKKGVRSYFIIDDQGDKTPCAMIRFKIEECKHENNYDITLKQFTKDLIQQIEISHFEDENGMLLENNKAYIELKKFIELLEEI